MLPIGANNLNYRYFSVELIEARRKWQVFQVLKERTLNPESFSSKNNKEEREKPRHSQIKEN